MMWIPYIIFKNTDDDEAVKFDAQTEDGTMRTKLSVKRENNFTRSGPEVADEVCIIGHPVVFTVSFNFMFLNLLTFRLSKIEIFKGEENIITMSQTHSKKFHCTYLLHYYPFDTQICKVDLQVEEFVKSNVELLPDKMELLTDTELTQYFLQSWTLDFNEPGNRNGKS